MGERDHARLRFQLAEPPGDWQDDMKATYRRRRRRLDDVSATV
jgi:hypothetical protein